MLTKLLQASVNCLTPGQIKMVQHVEIQVCLSGQVTAAQEQHQEA